MQRHFFLFIASLFLFDVRWTAAANWAVLVAGSNGWYNYRHQADLCHAYQILHANGIPDSNIIVMMYDDLAENPQNPIKGVIINHPDGKNVYEGVPHDYNDKDVTPQNFINILLGNKTLMEGIGSGKVLESGPDDNVFIYFTDHGAVGLIAFPAGVLYATDLNTTITKMSKQKKFKEMVLYIEACESGSMLENILPNSMNIYATTASNAKESSYACYYDEKRGTYLGDVYSVVWMEDSDAEEIDRESLHQQYVVTKKNTNTSHVMEYGDLSLGKDHNVSEFQSEEGQALQPQYHSLQTHHNNLLRRDAVPTVDVRLAIITHRLAEADENSLIREDLERELAQLIKDRSIINTAIQRIASKALPATDSVYLPIILEQHLSFTQYQCYRSVTEYIHEKCFDLQNEFVLNKLYIMANLCEVGLHESTINLAIDQVCIERLHFDY